MSRRIVRVEIECCMECPNNRLDAMEHGYDRWCTLEKKKIDKTVQIRGFPDFCKLEKGVE